LDPSLQHGLWFFGVVGQHTQWGPGVLAPPPLLGVVAAVTTSRRSTLPTLGRKNSSLLLLLLLLNPRALAYLISRDSELAYLLRSFDVALDLLKRV